MSQTIGILRLIRPINSMMMGFAVVIGELIALSGSLPPFRALLGFPVAFLMTAATMALNDYYDRSIDLINNPGRPIPSGAVSARSALVCALLFSATGILISAFLNMSALAIALFSLVLMIYYNTIGKRVGFLGNVVVSVCVSLPFIFGGYAVQNMKLLLWVFAFMAFLSNLGREVTKGIMDVAGDTAYKARTLAVKFGPQTASVVAAFLLASAVGLSILPQALGLVSRYYLPAIVVSDIGFITSVVSLLRDCSDRNARVVKNRILLWMTLGLVGFLLGAYEPPRSIF